MSGPLSPAVSNAAARMAAMAKCRAAISAWAPSKTESLPAKTWAAIPERTRLTLVMIAASQPGDPARICRQPWMSFTEEDRGAMAAVARQLVRDLSSAASLF